MKSVSNSKRSRIKLSLEHTAQFGNPSLTNFQLSRPLNTEPSQSSFDIKFVRLGCIPGLKIADPGSGNRA